MKYDVGVCVCWCFLMDMKMCDEKEKWEKVHFILNRLQFIQIIASRGSSVIFYNRGGVGGDDDVCVVHA